MVGLLHSHARKGEDRGIMRRWVTVGVARRYAVNKLKLAVILVAAVSVGAGVTYLVWATAGRLHDEAGTTSDERVSRIWSNSALQVTGAELAIATEKSAVSKDDVVATAKKAMCEDFNECGVEPVEAVYVQRVAGDKSMPSNVWMVTFTGICVRGMTMPPGTNPDDVPCQTVGIIWVDGKSGEAVGATLTNVDPAQELRTPNAEEREAYERTLATP